MGLHRPGSGAAARTLKQKSIRKVPSFPLRVRPQVRMLIILRRGWHRVNFEIGSNLPSSDLLPSPSCLPLSRGERSLLSSSTQHTHLHRNDDSPRQLVFTSRGIFHVIDRLYIFWLPTVVWRVKNSILDKTFLL